MSTLYVVATPIGNLEDASFRAVRILSEVGLIAAEDTRVTRKLLTRYEIHTRLTSYHEHNKVTKLRKLIATLAEKEVALVSDAGMPGVSDPGRELVTAAAEAGFPVVSVPGPSALTSAIAVSGLAGDQFVHQGFLPRRRADRRKLLRSLAEEKRTLVAFETPHRLRSCLEDILNELGDRRISVCRELTKLHEETFRGRVSEAIGHFDEPRGEFTLVVEGNDRPPAGLSEVEASSSLARLRHEGLGAKEAVARLVEETGILRREAYRMWLEAEGQPRRERKSERHSAGPDPN